MIDTGNNQFATEVTVYYAGPVDAIAGVECAVAFVGPPNSMVKRNS